MKTIIFFRHGKSDWDAEFGRDFDRPLAKRGRKAARRMGGFLRRIGEVPDLILTSPAARSADTTAIAADAGSWEAPIRSEPLLYESSPGAILRVIRSVPDDVKSVMLVGHEPSWSDVIGRLIGGGQITVPTAAMARIDLDLSSWREADFGKGQLIWLVSPKMLGPLMK